MTQRIASTTSTENDTVAFVDEVVDVVVAMDNGDDGDGVLERASRSASALASSTGGGDVASEMVEKVKRWELEQSQKIWDAVDAVVDFGKNVAFGSREITSAPMWTMNDAMENATNAVKSFAEVDGVRGRCLVQASFHPPHKDVARIQFPASPTAAALQACRFGFLEAQVFGLEQGLLLEPFLIRRTAEVI